MIVYLDIQTWAGINAEAEHYIAALHADSLSHMGHSLEYQLTSKDASHYNKIHKLRFPGSSDRLLRPGEFTFRFPTYEAAIKEAIDSWQSVCPNGEFLVLGKSIVCEPHLLIDSMHPETKELKRVCAELYEENKNTNDFKTELRLWNTYWYLLHKPKFRAKYLRLMLVNSFLEIIGNCGRRFFNYPDKYGYSKFEIKPPGRVWYKSGYSNSRYYLHKANWEKHFPEGGTLTQLIGYLKDFILIDKKLPHNLFGSYPEWLDNDTWGYGEDMNQVIKFAKTHNLLGEKE